jgi:hypothetical protein
MWIFKKKVTMEAFQEFEKRVKGSFQTVKNENNTLKQQIENLTRITIALIPLSKQFTELQHQFTELIKQFTNSSLNRTQIAENTPNTVPKQEKETLTNISDSQIKEMTQLEQKALIFIGRLQNETGSQMIPVGSLTTNLYPDRVNRKIKTTTSNILKKLIELKLINRERRGNYWYIGLTKQGYQAVRKELNQHQLKNLMQLYEQK